MTNKLPIIQVIVMFFLTLLLASCGGPYKNDWLKKGFVTPPDSAKPGVYWYFWKAI